MARGSRIFHGASSTGGVFPPGAVRMCVRASPVDAPRVGNLHSDLEIMLIKYGCPAAK